MKAGEVFDYLKSLNGGWVDYAKTVDDWKAGSPDVEVRGIAVGWMSFTWALDKAAALGCNLFITHEPTFYDHFDKDPQTLNRPEARAKRAKIEALGLTILRCHDLWDQYPKLGIPDSWGAKLGLGEAIDGKGYFRVYDGKGRRAIEIARDMAERVKGLGQEALEFVGPENKKVRRIVTGTGAITPFYKMLTEYQADMVVCTDDAFVYWRDGAFAADTDAAVVVFNHVVSEDYGLELLAGHLKGRFSPIPVHYVKQWCMYRLVR